MSDWAKGHYKILDTDTLQTKGFVLNIGKIAGSVAAFMVLMMIPQVNADDYNYTSLVYPDIDGKLLYIADGKNNKLPDYSHAGYMGGGVAIPYVPVVEEIWASEGDDAPRIQAAIDRVSALPLDENGFRGAVLLKQGTYDLDSSISITASGVVLRGEGQGETGTILVGHGVFPGTLEEKALVTRLVHINGAEGREELPETAVDITDEYVPFGASQFTVENARKFKVGDTIIVRRHNTDEWFRKMKLDIDNDLWRNDPKTHDFDRIITAIDGSTITIDIPLTCPIEAEWGGGEMLKYTDRRISNAGIENIRGISDFNKDVRQNTYGNMDRSPYVGAEYYSDEDHYWNFVKLDNVKNAWVRNVTGFHFAGSCVFIGPECKWITVEDCDSREPVSVCAGGRRFTYMIDGQCCLVQRCTSDKGRHSFVMHGQLTTGPNVFLNCTATRPFSTSEPHSNLVVGALYDNVHAPIAIRFAKSRIVRWMSIWSVLWNCEGMFLLQKPPLAQSYAFGQVGIHAVVFNTNLVDHSFPNGHIESWDKHVSPESLYLAQLRDRLGEEALHNIGY